MTYNNNNEINNDDQELLLNKKTVVEKDESIFKHKYFKEIIIAFIILLIFILESLLFSMYIPSFFQEYAMFKYPNSNKIEIQAKASYFKSYSDSLPCLVTFLVSPLIGTISDKYGRKPVLLILIIIQILNVISCFISSKTNNLIMFYIFHTLSGISNSISGIVFSVISDLSNDNQIAILFSYTSIAMGISFVFGPLIFVFTDPVPYLPLYVCFGVLCLSFIMTICLKESLTISKQIKSESSSSPLIESTNTSFNPFKSLKTLFIGNGYLTCLMVLYALVQYTGQDIVSTYYYYTTISYDWGPTQNGYFMTGYGCGIIVWGVIIIPFLLKYYSERKIVTVGFGLIVVAELLFVLSRYSVILFIGGASFMCLSPNIMILLSSVLARAAPNALRGSILASLVSIGALSGFLGSLAANDIFTFSISNSHFYFPQLIYSISICILIITCICSILIWARYKIPSTINPQTP